MDQNVAPDTDNNNASGIRKENLTSFSYLTSLPLLILATLPFISAVVPRFMGYAPAGLGLLLFIGIRIFRGKWPAISWPALFIFCGGLFLMSASGLWAINQEIVLERTLKLSGLFLGSYLLFAGISQSNKNDLFFYKISWPTFFVGVLIFTSIFTLVDLYTDGIFYNLIRDTSNEPFFNLSVFNRGILVLSLSSIIAFQIPVSKFLKIVLLIVLGLIFFKTETQSVYIGAVMALIFYLFFPVSNKKAWICLSVLLTLGVFLAPWIAKLMFHYAASWAHEYHWLRASYAPQRMEIWDMVARKALERPWFGHGVEATQFIEAFDVQNLYHPSKTVHHPHNFVMQIWMEFGAVGALFLASFMNILILFMSRMSNQGARMALSIFMAMIAIGAITYGIWQGWWIGTMVYLVGMIMIAEIIFEKKKQNEAVIET